MAEFVNQHFLQKAYIGLWDNKDELVFVQRKAGGKVFPTNKRNIGSEGYFYEILPFDNKSVEYSLIIKFINDKVFDTNNASENIYRRRFLTDLLNRISSASNSVYRKTYIEKEVNPIFERPIEFFKSIKKNTTTISDQDRIELAMFVAYTQTRSRRMIDDVAKRFTPSIGAERARNIGIVNSIFYSLVSGYYLSKFNIKIAKTNKFFIGSDFPVNVITKKDRHIIFLPVGRSHGLFLIEPYDINSYVPKRIMNELVLDEKNTRRINRVTSDAGVEFLFSSEIEDLTGFL